MDRNVALVDETVQQLCVALLAEGVDRNAFRLEAAPRDDRSPSSRRAWIEIFTVSGLNTRNGFVALLAEGVDRNGRARPTRPLGLRRSPRGGRG